MPFFADPVLGLGIHNHEVGHPKKGVWYEATGSLEKTTRQHTGSTFAQICFGPALASTLVGGLRRSGLG